MAGRRELLVVGLLTACTALYLLATVDFKGRTGRIATMAASGQRTASTKDLVVTLSRSESEEPNSITVSIRNGNVQQPMTFLKWDSPFDAMSLNSGVFKIRDVAKDEEIPGPGLRVSRMLPPARADLVEVPPQETVSQKLELKAPWIPTDGRSVKVHVQGEWRAVWPKSKAEVGDEELHAMTSDDVLKGPFETEQVLEMQL